MPKVIQTVTESALERIRQLNDSGFEVALSQTQGMYVVTAYDRNDTDSNFTEAGVDLDNVLVALLEKIS